MLEVKKCCGCKKIKSVKEFSKNCSKEDGFSCYCKGCKSERDKKYNDTHKKQRKVYRIANKEWIRIRDKKYCFINREKRRIYSRTWHATNLEKGRAYSRSWYRANLKRALACSRAPCNFSKGIKTELEFKQYQVVA